MKDLLTAIAPAAAAAASLAAIAVAIEQFTQRSRMRRIAEWTKLLANDETNTNRVAALAQIRAWAAGRVVATVMVPGRLFAEAALWLGVVPYMIIAQARSSSLAALALLGAVTLWLVFRRAIRVYLERYRIASEYFRGADVEPMEMTILFAMEGGTRAEFAWAALLSIGVTGTALGVALLIRSPTAPWGALAIVGGLGVAELARTLVRKHTPSVLHSASFKES